MAERRKRQPSGRKPIPRQQGRALTVLLTLAATVFVAAALYYGFRGEGAVKPTQDGKTVTLYFVGAQTKKWETETRQIPDGTELEQLRSTLREWLYGPKGDGLLPAIPPDIVPEAKLSDDGSVEVTFPAAYNELTAQEAAICNSSLVYTLTALPFITDVQVYIEDMALLKGNGKPVGALSRETVMLDDEGVTKDTSETRTLTLYFPDTEGLYLHAEAREVDVDLGQPIERYVVEQMIKGPTEAGLFPVIAPDTKLRSARTEDGGKCYVDFTDDFVKKFEGGSTAEMFLIYAIVDALTELPAVKEVQFLMDGEVIIEAKGFSMDLSQPVARNERLIAR